jgi:hypothetical protein
MTRSIMTNDNGHPASYEVFLCILSGRKYHNGMPMNMTNDAYTETYAKGIQKRYRLVAMMLLVWMVVFTGIIFSPTST